MVGGGIPGESSNEKASKDDHGSACLGGILRCLLIQSKVAHASENQEAHA